MLKSAEKAADWLLSGLELRSTLFHVGQYCGVWRASTAGHQRASFHLVLEGACWLHLPASFGRAARSTRLVAGDAVFFMHDTAHCLSPDEHAPADDAFAVRIGAMTPLGANSEPEAGVALACGFFEFRSDLGDAISGLLPEHIIARHDDVKLRRRAHHLRVDPRRSRAGAGRALTADQSAHRRLVLLRTARLRQQRRFRARALVRDASRRVRPIGQCDHREAGGRLEHAHDGGALPYVAGPLLQTIRRGMRPASGANFSPCCA